jgi:hypothetical protein
MAEEGITAVPADPLKLLYQLCHIIILYEKAYPDMYSRRWSDAPTNSD